MNQVKNLKKLAGLSYFDKNTLSQFINLTDNSLYGNIKRWLKQEQLWQLKKGLYVLPSYYQCLSDKESYKEFIANKLKEPSYLSLEYVMQKYSILTEAVYSFTSITPKSRRVYANKLGTFIYRQIKQDLFIGYTIKSNNGFEIKEATKAKALFDYLYLKNYRAPVISRELLDSYRLNLDELTSQDLKEFSNYCQITCVKKFLNLPALLRQDYAL